VVHPLHEVGQHDDADVRRAVTIVYLAETLRLAVIDYEQRVARSVP